MKTTTYLRGSLLIPFLVWGVCLLLFVITNISPAGGPSFLNIVTVFFLFYVFGILGWFIPYLLLSLILLVWSFRGQAQTSLIRVFALSPFAMAVLIMLFVTLVLGAGQDPGTLSPGLAGNPGEFLGSPLWFGILSLAWGYVNVAIGLGLYRLLQALGLITDGGPGRQPAAADLL